MSGRMSEKLIKAGLYILLMAVIALAVFLLMRPLVRSVLSGFAGQGDGEYKALPGDYEIVRVNSEDIRLAMTEEDGSHGHEAVGPYISAFWHDERYIVVKQYPGKKDGNYDRFYYCVDTETDEIFGPLDDRAYSSMCREKGIQIEKWILTVPKPDGAE